MTTGEAWTVGLLAATLLWGIISKSIDWSQENKRKIKFRLDYDGKDARGKLYTHFYIFNESINRVIDIREVGARSFGNLWITNKNVRAQIDADSSGLFTIENIALKDIAYIYAIDEKGNKYEQRMVCFCELLNYWIDKRF